MATDEAAASGWDEPGGRRSRTRRRARGEHTVVVGAKLVPQAGSPPALGGVPPIGGNELVSLELEK